MKSMNRIMNLALFIAIAAVLTSALCVSYELGHIDGAAEQKARMILATQGARERRQIETVAQQSALMVEVSAAPASPASPLDNYRAEFYGLPRLDEVKAPPPAKKLVDLTDFL